MAQQRRAILYGAISRISYSVLHTPDALFHVVFLVVLPYADYLIRCRSVFFLCGAHHNSEEDVTHVVGEESGYNTYCTSQEIPMKYIYGYVDKQEIHRHKMCTDVRWKKNLYEFTNLPDNYTDDTFLTELRRNVKSDHVSSLKAINLGASISIHLSIPVLFVIIFIWLYNEWTTPNVVLMSGISLTISGYLFYNTKILNVSKSLSDHLRTALIFFIFGYILSPVLRTLTETISTDTIYAMTILMFLIHLIFNKYGTSQFFLSDSLSITSSTFGSLMLASRLASPLHAFSLLTVSVQFFVLLPILLRYINNKIIISILLAVGIIYLLLPISNICCYVFIMFIVFIHFICPLWYIRCKQFKNNIYGPWDEAVITS